MDDDEKETAKKCCVSTHTEEKESKECNFITLYKIRTYERYIFRTDF